MIPFWSLCPTVKLVFVNRYFFPDTSATSQILSDAAFYLAERGHTVHVLTSRLAYDDDKVYPGREMVHGVTVHRILTTRFGRASLPGRAIDYLTFYISVFIKLLLLLRRDDIVVAKTDPPMVSIPVAWAAAFRKATHINWLQDLFPEVALALGMKPPGWITAVLSALRDQSLISARRNIVIGESMRLRLLKLGLFSDRIAIVPNWSDGQQIQPWQDDTHPLRDEWGLEGKFIVGYSGNLGRAHEIETLAAAMEATRDDEGLCFLMIGGGALMTELRTRAQQAGWQHCVFKPYQPRDLLPLTLTLPDVHLTILLPEMEGLIVPSKLFGVLAAGKPSLFVGNPAGEVSQLLQEADAGLVIKTGDSANLCEAINSMREDPSHCLEMGRNARQLFDSRFSASRSMARLEEAILC